MQDAAFEDFPGPKPAEVRISGRPIGVTPAKSNVDEYLHAHPDTRRLESIDFNLGDVQMRHEEIILPTVASARLEVAELADLIAGFQTQYGELLHPDALGCVLSIGNELLVKHKLSWDALVQGVSRPEVFLGDYLDGMAIFTAAKVFGRSEYDGKPLFQYLSPQEREDVFPFLLDFSRYEPHVGESMSRIGNMLEQHPIQTVQVMENVTEMCERMEALLAEPSGEIRNQSLQSLMEEFFDVRAQQTNYLNAFVISPFSRLSGLLEHSQFREVHTEQMKELWHTIGPWGRAVFGDAPDDELRGILATMREYVRIVPELPDITHRYIEAAVADAQAVGVLIDRREGETDGVFLDRLRELTRLTWSDKQEEFMKFLKEGYASGELRHNPDLILQRISDLCGVQLKHAQVTPTQTALMGLAAGFAMNSYLQTGEANVYQMQSMDEVMRKRVLITVPETGYGFEWRFTDSNLKSIVPLEEDPEFLEHNGPMNEMTKEQYDVFCELMEVTSFVQ